MQSMLRTHIWCMSHVHRTHAHVHAHVVHAVHAHVHICVSYVSYMDMYM